MSRSNFFNASLLHPKRALTKLIPPCPAVVATPFSRALVAASATYAYCDNACSFHITSNRTIVSDITPLVSPFSLSGIGSSGVQVTHSCTFNCYPPTNGINKGYYSAGASGTLLSLGYHHRCGGSYQTSSSRLGTDIYLPDGSLFDSPSLDANNMLPVSSTVLHGHSHPPGLLSRSRALAGARSMDSLMTSSAVAPLDAAPPQSGSHVNAERRARCDQVEALLLQHGYPPDDRLIRDIALNHISTHLTAADVRLNRSLRGPCPHQSAGSYRSPEMPPSLSPPATFVGQVLSFDLAKLPVTSPGGYTHELNIVDEVSGCFHSGVGTTSKTSAAVASALLPFISTEYTAHGHNVEQAHADDENVNASLAPVLGSKGIELRLTAAGDHSHRVERHVETLRGKVPSILSPLPYFLPLRYTTALHRHASLLMRRSVTDRSYPHTPDVLRTGRRSSHLPVQFGSCWMVAQFPDKRERIAKASFSDARHVPKTELGVCMGECPLTGRSLFVVQNNEILSRRPVLHLGPDFIPFGWLPKPYVPMVKLPRSAHTTGTSAIDTAGPPVLVSDSDGYTLVTSKSSRRSFTYPSLSSTNALTSSTLFFFNQCSRAN